MGVIDRFFYCALPFRAEVHVDVVRASARAPVSADVLEPHASFALTTVRPSHNENPGIDTRPAKLFGSNIFVRALATVQSRASVREGEARGVDGPFSKVVTDARAHGPKVVVAVVVHVRIGRGY